ncbi:hypothetical protein SNEBB_002249, partial [Seison nebaliae]
MKSLTSASLNFSDNPNVMDQMKVVGDSVSFNLFVSHPPNEVSICVIIYYYNLLTNQKKIIKIFESDGVCSKVKSSKYHNSTGGELLRLGQNNSIPITNIIDRNSQIFSIATSPFTVMENIMIVGRIFTEFITITGNELEPLAGIETNELRIAISSRSIPNCRPPKVSLKYVGNNKENPRTIYRSKKALFEVNIDEIDCEGVQNVVKKWRIFKLDSYGDKVKELNLIEFDLDEIDISSNNLLISKNLLKLGFYRAEFSLDMTSKTIKDIELLGQLVIEYFEVTKSPIILRLYSGVVSTLQWQHPTDLSLSMDEFTYDSDLGSNVEVAKVSTEKFKEFYWFCRRIGENLLLDPITGKYDTKHLKVPQISQITTDLGGCFSTGPGRIGSIELSTKLLLPTVYMKLTFSYEIIGVATFVDGRSSESSIVVDLTEKEVLHSSLKCLLPELCKSDGYFQLINFGSRISLDGKCLNCDDSKLIEYKWTVSYLYDKEMKQLMQSWPDFEEPDTNDINVGTKVREMDDAFWIHINHLQDLVEITNNQFVFDNRLMDEYPTAKKWKINLKIKNRNLESISSLLFKVNLPPKGGKCSIDKFNGNIEEDFTINCEGWKDDQIVNRFVIILRDPSGYLEETIDTFPAINGAFDSPQIINFPVTNRQLWVRIFDDFDSYSEIIIGQLNVENVPLSTAKSSVDSIKSLTFLNDFEDTGIMESDQNNPLLKAISGGDLQTQAKTILKTTQMLQTMVKDNVDAGLLEHSKNNSISNETESIPKITVLTDISTAMEGSEPISGFPDDLSENVNFNVIEKAMKSAATNLLSGDNFTIPDATEQQEIRRSMSKKPNMTDPVTKEREENAKVLNFLVKSLENGSAPRTVDEIGLKGSTLSNLASMTTGMSRKTVESISDQCNRLARSLQMDMSDDSPLTTIRTAAQSIAKCASSAIMGSVGVAYGRVPTLASDFDKAIVEPEEFDTDLENVWMNPQSFTDNKGNMDPEILNVNRNVRKTREMAVKNSKKSLGSLQRLGPTISKHLVPGDIIPIPSPSMRMTIRAALPNDMNDMEIGEGYSKIKLPKWCELMKSDCTKTTKEKISIQSLSMNVPPLQKINPDYGVQKGLNDDDVPVSMSSAIGLTFFDENQKLVKVENTQKEIEVIIPRDPKMSPPPFIKYWAFVDNRTQKNPMFKYHQFNITTMNASIHLNILPEEFDTCYIIILKKGSQAIFNLTMIDIDDVQIIGNNNTEDNSEYQYNFLENNGFKGMISIGIREVYESENFCNESGPLPNIERKNLLTETNAIFKSNYSLRLFLSGCYYYSGNKYLSDGLRVGPKTTWKYTQCYTSHLSEFAGGWVVLPAAIDFNYVFANASFSDNPTIYSTIIIIVVLYLLLLIYCRKKDIVDIEKLGVTPLPDNRANDKYFYEIITFTGLRQNAGTESKVRFILSGDDDQTEIRLLEDSKRKMFQRGATDAFIMATSSSIGPLTYLRIWHDNSGEGRKASWYLKYVIVHDLQTNEKFYFVCQRWLAVEKEDGLIDRILPVANENQKTEFSLLFTKKASRSMSDGHLWFSVFARPPTSTFTRVQRLTCCFTLLFLTMLMNIMYYDIQKDNKQSQSGLTVGPFHLTPTQIGIGVISSIIIIVPSMILVALFRHSKVRRPPPNRLREAIKKNIENVNNCTKKVENFYNIEIDVPLSSEDLKKMNEVRPDSTSSIRRPGTAISLRDIQTEENKNKFYKIKSTKKIQKKKTKKIKFPWWTIIFAYFLSFAICGVCIFFIISKGIMFGDEKVADWLTSLVLSFFSSILLTQPFKVITLALIVSLICKKDDDDDDDELSENENDIISEIQNKSLKTDERWLHAIEGTDDQLITTRVRARDVAPPNPHQLKDARAKRQKEMEMMIVLKEIASFSIFLMLLYVVAYGNRDSRMFQMTNHFETIFVNDRLYPLEKVNSFDNFFQWLEKVLIPNFRAMQWYNGDQPVDERGFMGDRANRILGYGIIRQLRVQRETCKKVKKLGKYFHDCLDDYSLSNEEKRHFDKNWTLYDWDNLKYEKEQAKMFADFEMTKNNTEYFYTDASSIDGLPYAGLRTLYSGGGYIFNLRGSDSILTKSVEQLKDGHWLDDQTRAIFIEWSIYNAWTNIFCSCTLLLEWLPATGFIKSHRFEPMSLLNHYTGFALFKLVCDVVFTMYIIFYTYSLIRQMYKKGKKKCCSLFRDFWFIVDFMIVALSITVIVMYIYRLIQGLNVAQKFKETNGNHYIRLQLVGYFNEMLSNFL